MIKISMWISEKTWESLKLKAIEESGKRKKVTAASDLAREAIEKYLAG